MPLLILFFLKLSSRKLQTYPTRIDGFGAANWYEFSERLTKDIF
jgi:hypothetical protein